jgi:hypothetical protein
MFPNARTLYEHETHPAREENYFPIAKGMVGWDHVDEHQDIDSANGGPSFVRVTMFAGKELSPEESPDNKAHGHQILCKVMGPLFWVPPKGTPVLIGFPDGEFDVPGSGVILGSIGPSPGIQFKKDKPKLDFGPDQDLVIKAKSVTISDYNNNYIMLGKGTDTRPIIKFGCASGSGGAIVADEITWYSVVDGDAKAVLRMNSQSVNLLSKDNAFIRMDSSGLTTHSQTATFIGGCVYLGRIPNSFNFAATFTNPPASIPIPSASVFISLV